MALIPAGRGQVISGALAALAMVAISSGAFALEKKLVVVTSYPPDTTVTVKKAFEKPNLQDAIHGVSYSGHYKAINKSSRQTTQEEE